MSPSAPSTKPHSSEVSTCTNHAKYSLLCDTILRCPRAPPSTKPHGQSCVAPPDEPNGAIILFVSVSFSSRRATANGSSFPKHVSRSYTCGSPSRGSTRDFPDTVRTWHPEACVPSRTSRHASLQAGREGDPFRRPITQKAVSLRHGCSLKHTHTPGPLHP